MRRKLRTKKNFKGFSLVELLIAIGIFAFVFAANFGLAMDAFRSRANDRVRLEAGLVFKDRINGLYNYKNERWSEIIDNIGGSSKRLDLVAEKYQINDGSYSQNGVEYEILIEKAARTLGAIDPDGSGNDPDTVKVSLTATWEDFFGITQTLTESYFLTNWASTAWTEDLDIDFNSPAPVTINSQVVNDSVTLTHKPTYASTDWCTVAQNTNLFPNGTGDVFSVLGISTGDQLVYQNFEPTVVVMPTSRPAPANPVVGNINNAYPDICDGTGVSASQCEALLKLYDSTAGDSWDTKTNWKSLEYKDPCTWHGVTCTGVNVTTLNLANNTLVGTLPREIGALTSLTSLDLSANTLTGSLPAEISNLTALTSLNLSRTVEGGGLTGVIPETIGNLVLLDYLNLSNNSLEGKIPQSVGLLATLDELYLQNNDLTCHIPPEIANLAEINDNILNPGLKLENNNLLTTSISALSTYFTTKNASVGNQGTPILHEDCMQRPVEDEAYLTQYNTTESQSNPIGYGLTLASEDFPPTLTKSIFNGASWLADVSKGLSFDGGDYLQIPASKRWNLHNDDATISLWVKRNGEQDSGNPARLIDYSDTGQGWYLALNSSEQVVFSYDGTGNDISLSSSAITNATWTHIVVVMDSGTATLYINGSQVAQDTYDNLTNHSNTSKLLRIGKSQDGNAYIGSIDEVKIFSRAVSINELTKSKSYEAHRKEGGLIGYWRLNQADQTQYDLSYQNAHATKGVNSSPWTDDPSQVDGVTRYRINDMFVDGDIIYISTTHPSHDVVRYDKSNNTFMTDINIDNDVYQGFDDTASAVTDANYIYIGQGSYLHKYTKVSSPVWTALVNLSSPYNSGNITDVVLKDGYLFISGTRQNAQLVIQDVSFTPTPKVVNLLLEAYL